MSQERRNRNTLLFVHVRRELVDAGKSLPVIVEDVNQIVRKRTAIMLADAQFLRQQISLDWKIETFFDNETTTPYDHPPRRWHEAQRAYFSALWGFHDPYQYTEESSPYNRFCLGVAVPGNYLVEGEKILALVDAEQDERHIYCPFPCYGNEVVYTSRHRLICMKCGHLHCALPRNLKRHFSTGFSEDDWYDLFDATGELIDDSVPLEIVDYREVTAEEPVWMTDAWLKATEDIEFYATATPEEIKRYEAGLVGPEAFLEAGYSEVRTVPPVTEQLREDGFSMDVMENAGAALKLGALAYEQSHKNPAALREAVLNLFQAVELILKTRLERIYPGTLNRAYNNSTVINKLQSANVQLRTHDIEKISELRSIRNRLQHSEMKLSYRNTRALLRKVLGFLDEFCLKELNCWMGDVVPPKAWGEVLRLEAIRRNAENVSATRIAELKEQAECIVQDCPNCNRHTLVRSRRGGSECMYCRHRPTLEDLRSDEPPSSSSSVK